MVNTVNLYWLALAFVGGGGVRGAPGRRRAGRAGARRPCATTTAGSMCWALTRTASGCWRSCSSGALAAAGGVVYVLLVGGASPHAASSDLTLSLLVMVVLGGPGTRWGPLAGGITFAFLDHRLTAAGNSDAVASLPSILSGPLSQPLFILGTVFILAVYFFPGGLAGLAERLGPLRRLVPARSASGS